jgi:hypothetical protein
MYAVGAFATMAVFTRWYEEPVLAQQFGTQYDVYRTEVPRWIPRLGHKPRNDEDRESGERGLSDSLCKWS